MPVLPGWNNVPANHHGVVFMDYVVAVHDITPVEVFPSHENLDLIVRQQCSDVAPLSSHEDRDWRLRTIETAHHFVAGWRIRNIDDIVMTSQWVLRICGLHLPGTEGFSIDLIEQEFCKVRVNRVRPVLALIADGPHLSGAFCDFCTGLAQVCYLPIHGPHTSPIIKLPYTPPLYLV